MLPTTPETSVSFYSFFEDLFLACTPGNVPQEDDLESLVEKPKDEVQEVIQCIESDPKEAGSWINAFQLGNRLEKQYIENRNNKASVIYKDQKKIWLLFNQCCEIYLKNRSDLEKYFESNIAFQNYFLLHPLVDSACLTMQTISPLKNIYQIHQIYQEKFKKKQIQSIHHNSCLEYPLERLFHFPQINKKNEEQLFLISIQFVLEKIPECKSSEEIKQNLKKLAGSDPRECSECVMKLLHDMGQFAEQCNLLNALVQRLHIGLELTRAFVEGRDNTFKEKYRYRVFNMHVGNGITFHGGYWLKFKKTGHAVVYEIERQQNYLYCLRMINTGAGTSRNKVFDRDKGDIVVCFKDISLEILMDEKLVSIILNKEGEIVPNIEKNLVGFLGNGKKEFQYRLQHFGTCSMSSIWGWLGYHLQHQPDLLKALNEKFLKETKKCISDFYDKNRSIMSQETFDCLMEASNDSVEEEFSQGSCQLS